MIKAIIFDWFGVCAEKWIDVLEKELRNRVDRKKLRESFFKYLDKYADNSITGTKFLELVFREICLEPKGYEYLLSKHGKVNIELLNFIQRLKKKDKTAILSDNFNEIVPIIEKEIGGFDKYFDVIILSNQLNLGKTGLDIYRKALFELGVSPEKTIFIDDKEKNLNVAKSLRIKTILYENNQQLEKELASYSVKI